MSKKQRVSATIDPDIKERLDNLNNINKSNLIETLLREYLAHGESSEVALKLRKQELDQQIQNKEIEKRTIQNEIDRLQEQKEEIQGKIKERRQAGLKGVTELVEKVENDEMTAEFIDETNPIIKQKASQAGVPPRRFAKEVNQRLQSQSD